MQNEDFCPDSNRQQITASFYCCRCREQHEQTVAEADGSDSLQLFLRNSNWVRHFSMKCPDCERALVLTRIVNSAGVKVFDSDLWLMGEIRRLRNGVNK